MFFSIFLHGFVQHQAHLTVFFSLNIFDVMMCFVLFAVIVRSQQILTNDLNVVAVVFHHFCLNLFPRVIRLAQHKIDGMFIELNRCIVTQ